MRSPSVLPSRLSSAISVTGCTALGFRPAIHLAVRPSGCASPGPHKSGFELKLLNKFNQLQAIAGKRTSSVCAMAATLELREVLVKAAVGAPDQLGDCPFSQRVLLTLEEKHVPYNAKYIDVSNKPAWFLEANPDGKVPVIKDEGKWISDSDVITQLLEKLYPEPCLVTPDNKLSVGSKIWGAFVKFLTSKDSSDGTEQALVGELKVLDEYLESSGVFVNGENISAVDLALAPKLYHLKIALGHYKHWSIPQDLNHVHKYVEALHSRESFEKTKAKEEFVIRGWKAKVEAS